MKCAHFVVDSTTHITASYPFDSGNSTTKSTLTTFHRSSGIGSGWSSPIGRCHWTFVRRHISQVAQYCPMDLDMFGCKGDSSHCARKNPKLLYRTISTVNRHTCARKNPKRKL